MLRRVVLMSLCVLLCATQVMAATIHVGPTRPYPTPSAIPDTALHDGDTIEIDAGTYSRDARIWTHHNLTIRGVGGHAVLDAQGAQVLGKGIWVIQGNNTTIESVTFEGAKVLDGNGAGIRQEGAGLTVRQCLFRANENGILTGEHPQSDILIEASEFDSNGAGDGYTHNMYIGKVRSFTLQHSWSHGARTGHLVKSRALKSTIQYNRLADDAGGTASYEVDFPNGGEVVVLGNIIRQDSNTNNSTMISYGAEGIDTQATHSLAVIHNTMIQDRYAGVFLQTGGTVTLVPVVLNNLFLGNGVAWQWGSTPKPMPSGNSAAASTLLVDPMNGNYRPLATTLGVNEAVPSSLVPAWIYTHPLGRQPRTLVGARADMGAYEYGIPGQLISPAKPTLYAALSGVPPKVQLTWTPQLHDADIPLTYAIARNGTVLASNLSGRTYTDTTLTYPGPLYTYALAATHGPMTSVPSDPVRIGGDVWDGQFASIPDNTAVFLGNYNCAARTGFPDCATITDYSRMIYDPLTRKLYLFGGGHATTMRDDVDTYDIATRTWTSAYPSTPCKDMDSSTNYDPRLGVWKSSGHPVARHTYDKLVITPTGQLVVMVPAVILFGNCVAIPPSGLDQPAAIARFDMQRATWSFDTARTVQGNGDSWLAGWEYDPISGRVIGVNQYGMFSYDLATQIQQWNLNSVDGRRAYGQNLVYFPPNQKMYYLVQNGLVYELTLNRENLNQSTLVKVETTGIPPNAGETGWAYDTVSGMIGGGVTMGKISMYNPLTRQWTTQAMNTLPQGQTIGSVVFHALDYSPQENVYFFLSNAAGVSSPAQSLWAYRSKASAPLFTGVLTITPTEEP